MTRFMQEISGMLGEWWQKEAVREVVKKVQEADNEAVVEEDGAIRWLESGNYVPDDYCEVLEYAGYAFSREATKKKRDIQTAEFIEQYRKNPPKLTAEDICEMRNAFGEGAVVMDVITGKKVRV